jgi:glycosyltransferase involved in cell wall biosynthesis
MTMPDRQLKVVHLIPGAFAQHSPTSAIAAQIKHHDPARVASGVVSFYPAPEGRSAAPMFSALGASHDVLAARRDALDACAVVALVRHLRRHRPDVLHCHFVRANIYGRLAARLTGVPVVICTLRGIDDYTGDQTTGSRVVRLVERATLPLVSRYVTVSDAVRRNAIETLGIPEGQIVTVVNAVDLSPFAQLTPESRAPTRQALGLDPAALVVVSAGNLIPLKNHQLAVRVVAELRRRVDRPIQLVIAGAGEEQAALEQLIAASGLQDVVRLIGLRRDIPQVLQASDVFLMLSLAEGLPRAAMEAMASGLPCVVSDRGGLPETVVDGHTGFVRPLESVPGIVAALEQLARDPHLRERFGRAGREVAFARFSPARLASDYEGLYRTVLLERGGARLHAGVLDARWST